MRILVLCLFFALVLPGAAVAASSPITEECLVSRAAGASGGASRLKALVGLAEWYARSNDTERAINTYKKALRENPRRKDAYQVELAIGDTYLGQQQYAQAIEFYQEAVNLIARSDSAHLRLAKAYEQSELYELARQEYSGVLKKDKKSFEANFGLACLFQTQGLTGQAMEYFRRALMLRPESNIYRKMACCAENMGDIDLAAAMLGQVIAADRTYEDELSRGRLFDELKKYKESEDAYSQAIKRDPGRIEGCFSLGLLYLRNNELMPAEKLLQLALKKAPDEGIIHFFLSAIYYRQHNLPLARVEIRTAISLSKSDILARYSRKFAGMLDAEAK